jgi:hypothetical protein
MVSREELKSLVDQLPEDRLEMVRTMLDHNVNPPKLDPRVEEMRDRSQSYRNRVQAQFRETRKPGTIGSMGGGGFAVMHEGTPYGRHGFSYWDEKALVQQALQSFDGHEIEIMERFAISDDRTKLSCLLELSSGGHTVRHEEEFPIQSL